MAIRLNTAREIEVDGLRFQIKPESFVDFLSSMDKADRLFPVPETPAPEDGSEEEAVQDQPSGIRSLAWVQLGLMARIVAWDGIELEDGTPAPCTEEAKLTLFGMMPELLVKISKKLSGAEASESKKSEPSQNG